MQEHDAPHPLGLLRARIESPRDGRPAYERDELPPLHSITSSARASSIGGMSRPSAFAVLRLNAVWKCDGPRIGTSPALAPLATWSTKAATSRNKSTRLTP